MPYKVITGEKPRINEIQKYLNMLAEGQHLSVDDSGRVFQMIMAGGATPSQIAATLMGLRINGETVDEITGAAMVLRRKAKKIDIPEELQKNLIDTCGTGGDKKGSYNISTTVAIVLAACGLPVAKHGNRAVSSASGSADVLKALGVNIEISAPEDVIRCLSEAGICFLMAPNYHSAMKNVGPTRLELGMRTIFNVLGPLINPAAPKRQILGVYSKDLVEPLAHVLKNLGSEKAWVVHGLDGMDEISIAEKTFVAELKDGVVSTFQIDPKKYGLALEIEEEKDEEGNVIEQKDPLKGGDAIHNARKMKELLQGEESAYRNAVILNAAAGLVVGGATDDIKKGVEIASDAIDSGKALDTLKKLVAVSNLSL